MVVRAGAPCRSRPRRLRRPSAKMATFWCRTHRRRLATHHRSLRRPRDRRPRRSHHPFPRALASACMKPSWSATVALPVAAAPRQTASPDASLTTAASAQRSAPAGTADVRRSRALTARVGAQTRRHHCRRPRHPHRRHRHRPCRRSLRRPVAASRCVLAGAPPLTAATGLARATSALVRAVSAGRQASASTAGADHSPPRHEASCKARL